MAPYDVDSTAVNHIDGAVRIDQPVSVKLRSFGDDQPPEVAEDDDAWKGPRSR